jgi:hypothetical protein
MAINKKAIGELLKLKVNIEKVRKEDMEKFMISCAKELAARLLGKVIRRTPVGTYGDKPVDFTVNLPERAVKFKTKDGKLVDFIAKAQTKHVKFIAKSNKTGGTLRRGWTSTSEGAAAGGKSSNAKAYTDSLSVEKKGDKYVIEIVNPVHYASYIEYGHRTRDHKNWVKGKFMLTESEIELDRQAPGVLEKKLQKYLEETFRVE